MNITLTEAIDELTATRNSAKFKRVVKIVTHFWGEPRQRGGSHRVWTTGWVDQPTINLQPAKGNAKEAKPYQVDQVLTALRRLGEENPDMLDDDEE